MHEASLYIHIPFCQKKCPYCHFFVIPNSDSSQEKLLQGLKLHIEKIAPLFSDKRIVTLYLGGGTPSLLGHQKVEELFIHLKKHNLFPINGEVTIEANPEDLNEQDCLLFRSVGINRLSLGIQSLDNSLLSQLGRIHTAEKAIEAVHLAKDKGFHNISIDLMYDLPGQSLEMWQKTIQTALTLPMTHLSLYNLTIEPNTLFGKHRKEIEKRLPKEEESKEMLTWVTKYLEEHDWMRYEISAFCKPGHESHHNLGYWKGRPFIGLGPSAFSYFEGKRFQNICHLNRYVEALEQGDSPIGFEENLPQEAKIRELIAIGIRVLEGVDFNNFDPLPASLLSDCRSLQRDGLVQITNNRMQLTEQGRLFYDSVATAIVSV